jgi:hypothetical protein
LGDDEVSKIPVADIYHHESAKHVFCVSVL